MTLAEPARVDAPRYLLAIVLAAIAVVLVVGGLQLLAVGGSAYYLIAGLLVGGSAWLVGFGDRRGVWLYGLMLLATLVWALIECGLDPWGLQARLLAPAVLGLWVAAPYARRVPVSLRIISTIVLLLAVGALILFADRNQGPATAAVQAPPAGASDWRSYGSTLGGTRFSEAGQITPANVHGLGRAWEYHTGFKGSAIGFEVTPLMVDGVVYVCASNNVIAALDADTGRPLWRFDPKVDTPPAGACRGVAYFEVQGAFGPCAKRIIGATTDARLLAVDAATGAPCAGFGKAGTVDLKAGMGPVGKGYYYVSSAPAIVRGNVILGGWVMDGQSTGEPSGVIRGFDAVTGAFKWAWDMGRPDDHGLPAAGQSFTRGTPNSWGPISGDEALGLVYLPTGNATPDYWGGERRPVDDRFSSSVVALDATSGQLRWSFQTVHHDLWDYDVGAQPTLVDLPIGGQSVPALIQATKQGEIYLLDRRTGQPLSRVQEKPVPQGPASGERLSPTQPFSTGMPSTDDMVLSEQGMWGATPLDQLWCRIKFRQARYDGPMTPPGVRPTITYPSYLGGIDWGGVSVDPARLLMVVNWNRVANYTRLIPRAQALGLKASSAGEMSSPMPQIGTPFAIATGPFLSLLGMPCTEPPFGKIGVVDLRSRRFIWQKPLGTSADSGPLGQRSHLPIPMGVPNLGGAVTTRSGLVFIAATQERAIRAFELTTGRKLWTAPLPAGGHATPMTYVSPRTGRQYVLIAAGGNAEMASGSGDSIVAFALPASPAAPR